MNNSLSISENNPAFRENWQSIRTVFRRIVQLFTAMGQNRSKQSGSEQGRRSGHRPISAGLILITLGGCSSGTKQPPPPAVVNPPDKAIIFQPVFEWSGDATSPYATGFFGRDADGRIAAVTCSSLLKTRSRPLRRICWMDISSKSSVQCYVKSWGPPGPGGVTDQSMLNVDLRGDYFILRADSSVPAGSILDLDARSKTESGERVWFPNKNSKSETGYDLVTGHIRETHLKYHVLMLDEPVRVGSQSGTPVISQLTGRVVGIISRDGRAWGRSNLGEDHTGRIFLLTPSTRIIAAMDAYDDELEFSATFGKRE